MIRRFGLLAAGLATVALVGAAATPAQASTGTRATAYLLAAQNPDGGFGSERGEKSDPSLTGWAALGLAAAGHNPRQRSDRGSSTIAYLRSHQQARDAGALARTLLVLHAAALSPRFAGRDIRAELMRHRRPDGSFGGLVNLTAFAILATSTSSGSEQALSNQQSAAWLAQQQNRDGGFSYLPDGKSGVDDTAAVLQALAATSKRESPPVRRAVDYLLGAQLASGGFGSAHSRSPDAANSMSTAWAIQGLIAAGLDPAQIVKNGHTPTRYLRSLQNPDGSIRYSRQSNHNPVWATAQALPALTGRPFPIDPVRLDAQPRPEDHSPAPAQETAQPALTNGDLRSQRAKAQKPPRGGPQAPGPDRVIPDDRPSHRKRRSAPSPSRAPVSPPERISGRSPERSGQPQRIEARRPPKGQPVLLALVALVALTGLAGWWWQARRAGGAATTTGRPSRPPASGAEATPGPAEDLDRELAMLLAGQSGRQTSEQRTTPTDHRMPEPHSARRQPQPALTGDDVGRDPTPERDRSLD
jgi:prenyltransferase beta subunit